MKPGATTRPAASMRCFAGRLIEPADGGDASRPNADVRRVPGRARPVDHVAVLDDQIVDGARDAVAERARAELPPRASASRPHSTACARRKCLDMARRSPSGKGAIITSNPACRTRRPRIH